MRCPFCHNSNDSVLDSRPVASATVIRRRRVCRNCQKRFTTYERLEEMPLMVVKSDLRREPFDREKLRQGILRACEKRPISIDTIDQLVAEVEYEMKDYVMEVPSKIIGEKVLEKLHVKDPVAYVRFASVYRNFSDVDSFLSEIKRLKAARKKRGGERKISKGYEIPKGVNLSFISNAPHKRFSKKLDPDNPTGTSHSRGNSKVSGGNL